MKWFASAVLVWAAVFVAGWFGSWELTPVIVVAAFLLVPAAVVVAITRYRLYEIDTLINRTLVYVPLVGIVAGLYAALVVLFGRLFTAVTGDTSDAAAIISALILATLFTPIRKSLEGLVDRYFKPAVSTPEADGVALPSSGMWEDPEHVAAVERIVTRVLKEQRRERRRRGQQARRSHPLPSARASAAGLEAPGGAARGAGPGLDHADAGTGLDG